MWPEVMTLVQGMIQVGGCVRDGRFQDSPPPFTHRHVLNEYRCTRFGSWMGCSSLPIWLLYSLEAKWKEGHRIQGGFCICGNRVL